ncbi:alpha/beta fold hydrolase [Hymenobacter sp. 15J16-1T3B]|uniref:alpha/beta fold hydrolase n=1 Tax=Hymenobacter sp. 15J16-1T3B TaxID=2886941 RepID=UPI001D0FAB20|nr:alpha/beta fold hydrolase [Hymenobacter sp. 15J16-1T3B]MCC3160536.1 alpha/beta fold hydrolase [Hymenobacter sp. 15J16-1T3B]
MDMHHIRRGAGQPLLLVHGIGGSWQSWQLIIDALVAGGREVIAVDLPGHGATPPLAGETSIRTLADALTGFLRRHSLLGVDAVGSSMGARLVLELVRRGGVLGGVVSLDPGGFWRGWEVPAFYYSVAASVRLVRALQPVMPLLTGNAVGRTALLAQFAARPWQLPAGQALTEMRSFAASPVFDELLWQLAYGERQQGAPAGSVKAPLLIGWGRHDRVCFPAQARRAQQLFPDAHLHWFAHTGHFPQWDEPAETARVVLAALAGRTAELTAAAPERASRRLPGAAAVGLGLLAAGVWWLSRRR